VDEPDPRETRRIDELLRPFLTDSMLWPVAIVVVLCIGTIGAFLISRAFEANIFAIAALLGLAWLSQDSVRTSLRAGPFGPFAMLVLVLWLVAAAAAVLGVRTGLL
jgi:hypothetical protein